MNLLIYETPEKLAEAAARDFAAKAEAAKIGRAHV